MRYAVRGLWRAPGFSFAVCCSLIVCIGPNAATLSALYALVLKPLPFSNPAQLVTVVNVAEKSGGQVVQSSTTQFVDFNTHANLFTGFTAVRREGVTLDEETAPARLAITQVTGDFFGLLGVQPVAGQFFSPVDEVAGRDRVLVLSRSFWESHYNADAGAIGRVVRLGGQPYTIVGVVSHPKFAGLDSRDNLPFVFVSTAGYASSGFTAFVRSARPASDLLRDMRTKLHEIDPLVPLFAAGSLQEGIDNQLAARRGITLLLGVFSGLALLLAAIGLYGVLAYDVTQRTREIGIRGAIGATRGQIVGLILRQGMRKTGVGLAVGLLGAVYLTSYLSTLLFGIVAADPVSYGAVLLLLAVVSLLACWLPARRAAKIDPIIALRAE